MTEHPKEIRRIYMVSSAVFSAASCVYGWAAPLGAALGLAVNLTEDAKQSDKEEFDFVVEAALRRTRQSISSSAKQNILEELCQMEVEPDSLSELIKKTEAYQTHYCTGADAKEILNMFEMFFRDEIAKNPHLSNLYVLSTGFVTLEKLELMNKILIKDDKKLDKIQQDVSDINRKLVEAKKTCVRCLNSIAFILVAMAVFLGIGIFSSHTYDKMIIWIAPVCYGISDFLIFFLGKEGYVFMSMREGILRYNLKISERRWKMIATFIIPTFLTVGCFWIILCAVDMRSDRLIIPTLGLILGNVVSIMLKGARFEEREIEDSYL
ncbi:MAG: hypothetical protein HDR01_10250 [Lachnospiraceae bacterium]|nr:hypothetical protein [Lachnospiraceae bacterium]